MADADATPCPDPVEGLSYEQARAELEDVVRRLEAADLPLDDLMGLWERGEALAAVCAQRLAGARARLDAVRAAREPESGDAPAGTRGAEDSAAP